MTHSNDHDDSRPTIIRDLLGQMFSRLLSTPTQSRRTAGLSTGYYQLDEVLGGGLRLGELSVLGRQTSTGGAALALNIAEHAALHESVPTLLLSLAHDERQVLEQIALSHARINRRALSRGESSSGEGKRFLEAAVAVAQAPVRVVRLVDPTTETVEAVVRRDVANRNTRLVILSHYQKVQLPREASQRYETAHDRQSFMSRTLKALAKSVNVAFLVVSELTKLSARNPWRQPGADDLDGSGRLHDDADVVLLLRRPSLVSDQSEDRLQLILSIEKNRFGPVAYLPLLYLPKIGKFENHDFVPEGETAS